MCPSEGVVAQALDAPATRPRCSRPGRAVRIRTAKAIARSSRRRGRCTAWALDVGATATSIRSATRGHRRLDYSVRPCGGHGARMDEHVLGMARATSRKCDQVAERRQEHHATRGCLALLAYVGVGALLPSVGAVRRSYLHRIAALHSGHRRHRPLPLRSHAVRIGGVNNQFDRVRGDRSHHRPRDRKHPRAGLRPDQLCRHRNRDSRVQWYQAAERRGWRRGDDRRRDKSARSRLTIGRSAAERPSQGAGAGG